MIRFGFCNIRNNQGRGYCQITLTSTLVFPDIAKTVSNNCSKFYLPSDVMTGQIKIPYTIILSQYCVFQEHFVVCPTNCASDCVTMLWFCQRASTTAILVSQDAMRCFQKDPIHAEKTFKLTLLPFLANYYQLTSQLSENILCSPIKVYESVILH